MITKIRETAAVLWSFLVHNDWKEAYYMDLGHELCYARLPKWLVHVRHPFIFAQDNIIQIWALAVCGMTDHLYVDDSYGNAESGGDGWHCARCGESHWIQYY